MTTFTSPRAEETVQPYGGGTNEFCIAYGSFTPTSFSAGDEFELCRLPAGATLVGGRFFCEDLDSNGSPTATISVGIDGAPGKYMSERSNGSAAVDVALTTPLLESGPITEPNPVTVVATAGASAATFSSGTMTLTIFYVLS